MYYQYNPLFAFFFILMLKYRLKIEINAFGRRIRMPFSFLTLFLKNSLYYFFKLKYYFQTYAFTKISITFHLKILSLKEQLYICLSRKLSTLQYKSNL